MEDEVFAGTLNYLKPAALGKKWTKKWGVLYKRSMHGIQRLELHDTKDSFEKREKANRKHVSIIDLKNCSNIVDDVMNEGKKTENVIKLNFTNDDKQQVFSWESPEEMSKWFKAISSIVFEMDHGVYQKQVYEVEVRPNDMSIKLNLEGVYLLNVSTEEIDLLDKHTRQSVLKWPLPFLRKYGRDKGEFSLEAGRRCPSGPGMFYFKTDQYTMIFQDVENKVKSLASIPANERNASLSPGKVGFGSKFSSLSEPLTPPSRPPLSTSLYQDPVDFIKDSSANKSDNYTYTDPIEIKAATSAKPRKLSGQNFPIKSQQDSKGSKPKGGIPFIKGNTGPKKPPRRNPAPPDAVPEANYSDAIVQGTRNNAVGDLDSQYSHLSLGATNQGDRGEYDSISYPKLWRSPSDEDSAYSTTGNISGNYDEVPPPSDSLYDHVKR